MAGRPAAARATLVLDRGADLGLDLRRHLNVVVTPFSMLSGLAQHVCLIMAVNHEVAIDPDIFTRKHLPHRQVLR